MAEIFVGAACVAMALYAWYFIVSTISFIRMRRELNLAHDLRSKLIDQRQPFEHIEYPSAVKMEALTWRMFFLRNYVDLLPVTFGKYRAHR